MQNRLHSGPRYYKCNHQIEWQYHLRQTSVLQFFCSEVEPHAAPVPACGVVILLVRVCVPVPQFLLHVAQAPQAPMTQSTAEMPREGALQSYVKKRGHITILNTYGM